MLEESDIECQWKLKLESWKSEKFYFREYKNNNIK